MVSEEMRRTWLAAEDRRRLSVHGSGQKLANANDTGQGGSARKTARPKALAIEEERAESPNTPLEAQEFSQTTSENSQQQLSPATCEEVTSKVHSTTPQEDSTGALPNRSAIAPSCGIPYYSF